MRGVLGTDKPRCTATSSVSKDRCKQPAIPGGKVCIYHGGNAPQVRSKANERVADEKLRKELGKLNIVPVENPLRELQNLAGEARAWKELCAEHVATLERLRYSSGEGGEQIRGEILLFERAIDRCASILSMIARHNIDERLARIQERQVELVTAAMENALGELGLDDDRRREARHAFARHLRIVSGHESGAA